MGKKRKRQQFAEIKTFDYFFELDYHSLMQNCFPLKGEWNRSFFKNEKPVIIELGCGKGEYTVGLARMFPQYNYIGIDRKSARMWRGAKTVSTEKINNVAFIRGQIENIEYYFAPREIEQIWITFPDPQLQKPRVRKRLTHSMFLERYRKILTQNHCIHLKTDDDTFYQFTLEVIGENKHHLICNTDDLYRVENNDNIGDEVRSIKTFYEQMWLKENKKIKYIKFQLSGQSE
ncbi:MAG: tRNA (guanosine(46)-N7)-methyltransferase TrmB [Bacteroidales bacterium]|jgi:tRNA (guanine-N7-)-methyltransferase|nr:tRNA (guanosine(46)-N7)-methyltransferase TrmB [Bacteroidales bacterium]